VASFYPLWDGCGIFDVLKRTMERSLSSIEGMREFSGDMGELKVALSTHNDFELLDALYMRLDLDIDWTGFPDGIRELIIDLVQDIRSHAGKSRIRIAGLKDAGKIEGDILKTMRDGWETDMLRQAIEGCGRISASLKSLRPPSTKNPFGEGIHVRL